MILGMSTATFTVVHVILSLIGIVSGIIVLVGMFSASRLGGWTALFLATTVLTIALLALYGYRLVGPWRWLYVGSAVWLAPTQTELPFLVTQLIVMAIFAVLGLLAVMRFRPVATPPAQ